MSRIGWKLRKAVKVGQPSDAGRAADGASSSEPSHQDEERIAETVASEDESASVELQEPCLEEPDLGQGEDLPSVSRRAELEAAFDAMLQVLEDSRTDGSANDSVETLQFDRHGESIGWTIRLTRGRIVDVTDKHVILSDDSLGTIVFDDGEALSVEGVRQIGW